MYLLRLSYTLFYCALTTSALVLTKPPSLVQPQNVTHPESLTATYSPQCHLISAAVPLPGLNPSNCQESVPITCKKVPGGIIPSKWYGPGTWFWTDEDTGCALGLFLQENQYIPDRLLCERTFNHIIEKCATNSSVNAGTANVLVLPDEEQDGRAIRNTNAMFVMAPRKLT